MQKRRDMEETEEVKEFEDVKGFERLLEAGGAGEDRENGGSGGYGRTTQKAWRI